MVTKPSSNPKKVKAELLGEIEAQTEETLKQLAEDEAKLRALMQDADEEAAERVKRVLDTLIERRAEFIGRVEAAKISLQ